MTLITRASRTRKLATLQICYIRLIPIVLSSGSALCLHITPGILSVLRFSGRALHSHATAQMPGADPSGSPSDRYHHEGILSRLIDARSCKLRESCIPAEFNWATAFPSAASEALPDLRFAGDSHFGVDVPIIIASASDHGRRSFLRGLRELCRGVSRRHLGIEWPSPAAVLAAMRPVMCGDKICLESKTSKCEAISFACYPSYKMCALVHPSSITSLPMLGPSRLLSSSILGET